MAQEIELKFIVEKDSVDALRQHLHTLSGEHHAPVQLLNIYYETPDNWLRRHDMGLRIRGASGRYEMTMKIAGRVVGGLHQRPEYNIDISQPELELERFPAEVDLGEVKAGEYQEPICELELELLEGDANDVLKLARRLVNQSGLRQGSLSKAARGYHLAAGNAPRVLKETTILRVAPKASVEQGLEAALELALSQWQYHEELWVRNVKNAKSHVLAAIALVRHTLTLFGGIVPRKASAHLRDLLTQTETLMLSDVSAQTAIYSPQAASAKLALTEFLVTRGWRAFLDAKAEAKIAENFKRFADIHLSRHAAELKSTFAYPLGDKYGDQLPRLSRNIDSMLLLSGAYDGPQAQAWLENWQGLKHAIETRQHIEIEHFRNEAISQEPYWLHSGKR